MILTPEQLKDLRDAIDATINGKQIQFRNCSIAEWTDHRTDEQPNFALKGCLYRPKPAPTTRPWSWHSDVPSPVCWIRGDGILAMMIVAFSTDGSGFILGNISEVYSWSDILTRRLEYSTDRVTWHKCEVSDE